MKSLDPTCLKEQSEFESDRSGEIGNLLVLYPTVSTPRLPCTMKLLRRLRSLIMLLPLAWFLYVSLQLMSERSASLAAMELAYRLHEQDHHPHNQLSLDAMPHDPDTLSLLRQVRNIWGKNQPSQASSQPGRLSSQQDGGEVKQAEENGGDAKASVADALSAAGAATGDGTSDDNVTFPPYVEDWVENGPGENGEPFVINSTALIGQEKERYEKGWKLNSFNQYASDRISVHRSLPDNRSPECKAQTYAENLPEVSVILIFHNEAWSVLLRSVHSILSRTPQHLLREVILVDDFSSLEHLKGPLEVYWRRESKVQIVRAEKREGLTRARLLGYKLSTAPVLVFLDSHIECFPGWLEPMLSRVHENSSVTVFPSIETILEDSLAVNINNNIDFQGVFRWKDLTFQWAPMPAEERKRRSSPYAPIRSPTMPGGLFAIDREFFTKLGKYDPELDYWGGENIELSFKAWLCHGSVELIPCSHIGHIFRRSNPIRWTSNVGAKNSVRVAEVWMDDYKNYFYEAINYKLGEYGDVTERRKLREQLQCRNFSWYVENVYPNLKIPRDVIGAGEIRSEASPQCMDNMGGSGSPKLYGCHGMGTNQFWYFSKDGVIYSDSCHVCEINGTLLQMGPRPCASGNWKYREDQTIYHEQSQKCLQASATSNDIVLSPCTDSRWQKWHLQPRRTDLVFP